MACQVVVVAFMVEQFFFKFNKITARQIMSIQFECYTTVFDCVQCIEMGDIE